MKNLFILTVSFFLIFASCSKKDDAIVCLDDAYTGTYVGNVTINNVTSAATIKFTKKGCSEAQIETTADIGDKNIASITQNGENGFTGTLTAYGSPISMKLSGNTITIIANSRYSFVGTK